MIQLIKFIYYTFILPPGIFIIAFFILTFKMLKQRHKYSALFLAVTVPFYLFSTPLVSNMLIRSLEAKYVPPSKVSGDVIVMLGGGATLDTPNVYGKGHLSGSAANRLLTTVTLQRMLNLPVIISGGQVYDYSGCEAEIASNIIKGLGVSEEMIIIENKSLNTTQNAQYTKTLLNIHEFKQPILVTSAMHMPRSVFQFNKLGIIVTPYPSDYLINVNGKLKLSLIWPNASSLEGSQQALKEYLGILVSRWY